MIDYGWLIPAFVAGFIAGWYVMGWVVRRYVLHRIQEVKRLQESAHMEIEKAKMCQAHANDAKTQFNRELMRLRNGTGGL